MNSKYTDVEQSRFKELFAKAASAIVIMDQQGEILFSNPAFTEITGYGPDEAQQKPLHEIITPAHDVEGREYLCNLFRGPTSKNNLNLSIIDKEGHIHFVDMTAATLDTNDDTPENCICIMHDLTAEKEAELRREELIEELMEVKELQEDNAAQLATLLHELDEKNYALEQEIAERKKAQQKLKESEERFKNMSITDQLTGLFNRRHMLDVAEKEIFKSRNTGQPLSILLMDVDDFKMFNDTYGHAAGDDILESIGRIIKKTIRNTDRAFRYGGEEFMVILPGTSGQQGMKVAEDIRSALADYEYRPPTGPSVYKTMSIGVAEFSHDEPLERVIKRADDNMYRCKIKGKNRVYFSCE
ncbi:sensor domain-containing diguanylate cyclase [Desulfovibrio sp. JC010]|uniref:sensor domain-containing diguanylate cyclase n=1 Tax=Desulfovibrio sp. JC010 TaxID=2593641 RepID=UPI001EF1816B|nr:sensor domain-containing diguanylate cyclase [Desulfovibrio sp. JC010]